MAVFLAGIQGPGMREALSSFILGFPGLWGRTSIQPAGKGVEWGAGKGGFYAPGSEEAPIMAATIPVYSHPKKTRLPGCVV